jgi:hypothetical protein
MQTTRGTTWNRFIAGFILLVLASCETPTATPTLEPPKIQNPSQQVSLLMQTINLVISVTKDPQDSLSFTAQGLPQGLEIDALTGVISGKATLAGSYEVTVRAQGNQHKDEIGFTWIINAPPSNTAPTLTSPGNQETLVNEPVELQLVASDADGDDLSFSSSTLPPGLSLAATTGFITGTPTQVGSYAVVITVNDGHEGLDTANFTWEIKPQEPASPLVAHWTFDETTGNQATDSSGNNNTGTVRNGGWSTGRVNGALEMNGGNNSIVEIPLSPSLRTTAEEITVMAWAYRTANHNTAILSQTYPAVFFGFHKPTQFKWGLTNETGDIQQCYADTALYKANLNTWYHMAGTYDGTMLRLYVDGEEICTLALSGPREMPEAPLTISGYLEPPEQIIDEITGKIDDVRIYNKALTAEEIKSIYQSFE